jgi:hypothetical protein
MQISFDDFLRAVGPERMMVEIAILRAALHATTRDWRAGKRPPSSVEQECVDEYVAHERMRA